MSSEILRKGKRKRPSWSYVADGNRGLNYDLLEMMESVRNVCEDIRGELQRLNTLLHCSNFQRIPARLKRISANTYQAKHGKRAPDEEL